jgi:hypothetical protein
VNEILHCSFWLHQYCPFICYDIILTAVHFGKGICSSIQSHRFTKLRFHVSILWCKNYSAQNAKVRLIIVAFYRSGMGWDTARIYLSKSICNLKQLTANQSFKVWSQGISYYIFSLLLDIFYPLLFIEISSFWYSEPCILIDLLIVGYHAAKHESCQIMYPCIMIDQYLNVI